MPTLESEESEHESPFARVLAAADEQHAPTGLEEWWKTPQSLYQKPVAVDPKIYGLEASDVGHQPPTDLNAYIGMSNATVQAGTSSASDRKDRMQASDGHRANAMAAELLVAAKLLDGLRSRLDTAMNAPLGERSPDAIAGYLASVLGDVKEERTAIALVFEEQFKAKLNDRVVRDAFLHVTRASHLLDLKVAEAQRIARSHGATTADVDALQTNSGLVKTSVGNLAQKLDMVGADDSKVKPVAETEAALRFEAVQRSLSGVEESVEALVLAAREADPKSAIGEVLPGLLSNARILDASLIDGVQTTKAMSTKSADIVETMGVASRTAGPSLDGAKATIERVMKKVAAHAKGKATK